MDADPRTREDVYEMSKRACLRWLNARRQWAGEPAHARTGFESPSLSELRQELWDALGSRRYAAYQQRKAVTPLAGIAASRPEVVVSTDVWTAAYHGRLREIYAHVKAGIDVNERQLGVPREPPLHDAVVGRQMDAVKALLELGADPALADDNGNTALHLAARWGRTSIAKHLVKVLSPSTGDEVSPLLAAPNRSGQTPHDLAVQHGHRKCAALLPSAHTERHHAGDLSQKVASA